MWFNTPRDTSRLPSDMFDVDSDAAVKGVIDASDMSAPKPVDGAGSVSDGDSDDEWNITEIAPSEAASGSDSPGQSDDFGFDTASSEGSEVSNTIGGSTVPIAIGTPISTILSPSSDVFRKCFGLTCIAAIMSLMGGVAAHSSDTAFLQTR